MNIPDFIKKIREARKSGRRTYGFGNPLRGLEYNKFQTEWRTGKSVYSVDIARNPRVIKNIGDQIEVNDMIHKVNSMADLIYYREHKVKGRVL